MMIKILLRFSSFVAGIGLLTMSCCAACYEYTKWSNPGLAIFGIYVVVLFFLMAIPLLLWPITPSKWWEIE